MTDHISANADRLGPAAVLRGVFQIVLSVGLVLQPAAAWGQLAAENAVAASDDAFGASVGRESTGIYTETNIRGFDPLKAGNARIDGVYFDQVSNVTGIIKAGTAMRVGFAALDFPFPAPTGIVDNTTRSTGNEVVKSASVELTNYFGTLEQFNIAGPIIRDRLSVVAGLLASHTASADGASYNSASYGLRPTLRLPHIEISPFVGGTIFRDNLARPLVTIKGPYLPNVLPAETYLGQDWTTSKNHGYNYGLTTRAELGRDFNVRGGVFHSQNDKPRTFVEIFSVSDVEGHGNDIVVADPEQTTYSDSWEGQLAWSRGDQDWLHRIVVGARGRLRHTETGGSDVHVLGPILLGSSAPVPEPSFHFGGVNVGQIDQKHFMIGYFGRLRNVGAINLGVQRANYKATFRTAAGLTSSSSADPVLFNASIRLDPSKNVSVFAGYVRGLEDSGTAPETAANRNEQLPATETEQLDGGVRVKIGKGHLVTSVFQITKPYFSFDTANNFDQVATVRHRGVEISYSGTIKERLQLVAGAVLLDPKVSGSAVTLGLTGDRPVGTPETYVRIDANYRTDIWGGLTPTMSITYTSERPASAAPYAALGGKQLMLPARTTLDIGARYAFKVGTTAMSFRMTLANLFDDASWRALAPNTLGIEERRRFSMALSADF